MKRTKEHWEELNFAIKKHLGKDKKVNFQKFTDDEVNIVIFGIDNKYETPLGKFNWEIFLKSDGTWKIN